MNVKARGEGRLARIGRRFSSLPARHGLGDRRLVCGQTPQKHSEIRQVVTDGARGGRTHVGSVGVRVERRAEQREHSRIVHRNVSAADDRVAIDTRQAQRRNAAGVRSEVIVVLVPGEVLAQFDHMRSPLGEVVGQQLNRADSSLATPQRDGIGNVSAQSPGVGR